MGRPVKRKADLLDAALLLFMKKGIKATTTRDIAERAGVSEGTIYRHFASKDELAAAIFAQNLDYFWRFLRRYLRRAHGASEILTAFVCGVFEFARRYHRRYSFIMSAHQTELRRLSRNMMKPKKMLAKIIRLGQSQGAFRPIDPRLAASMILGTITQTIFYLKSGQIVVNFDEVVKEVAEACLRIIAHRETPSAANSPINPQRKEVNA